MSIDPKLKEAAQDKFRVMFRSKSFIERLVPVIAELSWILSGKPDAEQHQKLLPDYCYPILELCQRNLFKAFPTLPELKQADAIRWEKIGAMVSVGQRCLQFVEQQMGAMIDELELDKLPEEEIQELVNLFINPQFLQQQQEKFSALNPGKPVEEIIEAAVTKQMTVVKMASPHWENKAYQAGSEALNEFKAGSVQGVGGFLGLDGEMVGERKIKLICTYVLLIIAWPEIDEMIHAQPPKRMEDLWNWLTPFSYAGFIEIKDLDQLVSLCRPLKLKLKKPGAPRKPRKC